MDILYPKDIHYPKDNDFSPSLAPDPLLFDSWFTALI